MIFFRLRDIKGYRRYFFVKGLISLKDHQNCIFNRRQASVKHTTDQINPIIYSAGYLIMFE